MSKTSILMHSNATKTNQDNIASKNAWGKKKSETLFINSVVGGGAGKGGVSYVTSNTRSSNNVQGTMVSTGVNSDLGMQGQGMFVVADSATGNKVFTRRGDFRQDELGYWKNGSDLLLFANKLDKDENPPKDAALLSSLSAVNFANVKGDPKATTTISIAMNFNSAQEALRGSGVTAAINKTGLNASVKTTKKDILFTESLSAGSLTLGDRFTFTSTPPGVAKTIEYGGLAIAAAPTPGNPFFGASKVGTRFNIGGGAGQVPEGAALRIASTNGDDYTFSVAANAQASNKSFNSIQSLADAINKVGGFNAKINANGNLYIASEDPDVGITFENKNNGTFVDLLGLVNVPSLTAAQALNGNGLPTQRFNNLQTLNAAVNSKADDYSLKATIESSNLKITSLLATDQFTIDGQSLGVRSFSKAVQGDGTEKGRASIEITSPQHGLQTGDLVQMTGINGGVTTPNGIYAVGAVDNDTFEIFPITSFPGDTTNAAVLPAALGPVALAPAANASWQKIPGQKFASDGGTITASADGGGVAGNDNGRVTITTNRNPNNLAQGDVVYISGGGAYHVGLRDIKLPDGYYVVLAANLANNTFSVKPYEVAIGAVFPAAAGLNYQKVGRVQAGVADVFNTTPNITTFNTTSLFSVPAAATNLVTLSMSSHNYSIGDMIRFTGLPAGYAIDGLAVANNVNYKVTASTADSVTFEVAGIAQTGGNLTVGTYDAGANNLSPNFRVDNVSRLLEYFSISEDAGKILEESYNPDEVNKSLSGNEQLKPTESFVYPLSLYDSLGENYNLLLRFAKLAKNEWAIEVATEEDPDTGQYNVLEAGLDGQIKNGRIKFDENGQFLSAGALEGPITVTRKNGSAPSQVTIDWKNELGKVKTGTLTQYESNSAFNVELIQQDGQASGNLVNLDVSPEGFIVGTFDSGQTRKLYQIPIALFANVNGLRAGIGGTFEVTRESGDLLLKTAMSGGAGKILGGVLEASNVDPTEELLSLQDLSNDIRANARAANVTNKNIQTILSEIQ